MNSIISSGIELAQSVAGLELSAEEKLIADIFELDPKELSQLLSGNVGKPIGVETAVPTAAERRDASEPGSFERDFWEEVASFEEQLTGSGERGDVAQAAIALAAANFSLQQSFQDGAGHGSEQRGGAGSETPLAAGAKPLGGAEGSLVNQPLAPNDGATALVAARAQLENRAHQAVLVAQGFKGSALKAAGGGKG